MIAIFLDRMASGEPTRIFGDGNQTRDFIYVGDIVSGVLAAVGHQGVYNLGTGVETSVKELHSVCRRVTGDEREPEYSPAREGEILRSVVDPSRAERDLGWRAQRSLEDGLRLTWEEVRTP